MLSAPNSETAPVSEGDILDGKYRVERVLGVGGMGIVVAATHLQLEQRVALKFLLPSALGNPEIVARFAREARAAVRIQSEHVARVIDVGTLTTGSPYMVMEYLEGCDLAATLQARGPLAVVEVVTYLLEACEAIAEAHAMGVVHRDLKPANLFLARRSGRNPMIKVLDFGISKTTDAAVSGLTHTAVVMGSPLYMSPEQMMSSRDVDLRTDIWSLGVVLYELLAGKPPFVADTMAQLVFNVTNRDASPVTEQRPDAPTGLAEVVQRCLKRTPTERFANIAELAQALVPFGTSRAELSLERISRVLGATAAAPAAPERRVARAEALPHSALPELGESRTVDALFASTEQKRPLRLAMAVLAVVLLLGVIALWRSLASPTESPPAPALVSPAAPKAPAQPEPVNVAEPAPPQASPAIVAPTLQPVLDTKAPAETPPRPIPARPARPREAARRAPPPDADPPVKNRSPLHMEMK